MFNFFKSKKPFETFHSKISAIPVVSANPDHKPIVAAYLYTISDYIKLSNGSMQDRQKNATEIFNILENGLLSPKELSVFDAAVSLFGAVIRKTQRVRGDWNMTTTQPDNPIYRVYLCFGDLIYSSEYLKDYQNSPVVIRSIDEVMMFTAHFTDVLEITKSYTNEL